jgi:hypothetical protein
LGAIAEEVFCEQGVAEDTGQAGAVSQNSTCLNGGGGCTNSKNTGEAVLLHNGVFCNGRTATKIPFMCSFSRELRGLHIHVSVSDLHIPRIGPLSLAAAK